MVTTPILLINEVAPTQTDKTTTINDAIVALESATQDQLAVSLAGGNLTLSATQFTRYAVFSVSGQTTTRVLTVPLTKRLFGVKNAGSYDITVGGASGSTVTVAAGDGAIIQCDATNCSVFGSGGPGATGATGPAGAISSIIAGAGLSGGTISTSGQTIAAQWQGGTVTALGSHLSITTGTLQSVDTNVWDAGTVTAIGTGITLSSGTLTAPSGGGTVTGIATTGGIHGGIITTSGTLTVDWNGGSVSSLGSGLSLSAGVLNFATIASHAVLANSSGSGAAPSSTTVSAILDAAIGSTQGNVLYRNASVWSVLAPGTSGQVLQSGGAAANPSWATAASGSVTSVASGAGLSGGPVTSSGTLLADWNGGTVTSLGSGLNLSTGTLTATTTPRNNGVLAAQWVLGTVAANGDFYFAYKAPYAGTVNSLDSLSGTGTFTLAVKINGTNVTGLSAVAVSTAANTAATAANTFSAGDTITGTISSASGSPTDAVLSLNVTWS
jgi:hypothetical protein